MRTARLIILIDCGIALKEVPLSWGKEAVFIVAHESVDRESNAIPVHPITAGSAVDSKGEIAIKKSSKNSNKYRKKRNVETKNKVQKQGLTSANDPT